MTNKSLCVDCFDGVDFLIDTILGIGRDIAIELWRAGAEVVALSKTRSNLESLKHNYPSITIVDLDQGDWEYTRKVIDGLGCFDALVNNAAVVECDSFFEISPESFDTMFNINVKSVLNVSQLIAKKMIENEIKGTIVNISSIVSKIAMKNHLMYGATKAALDAVSRGMALELGPFGIRVNVVNPTVILTEKAKLKWSNPEKANDLISRIPLGRFGEISEVTNVVLFLLSGKASFINGTELPIDGGYLAA